MRQHTSVGATLGYGSDAVEAEAVRIDPETGIRESAECFVRDSRRLFGFRHMPVGTPTAGVIVCSSLLAEAGKNYRREFELGRRLAAKGFAVQRFHYAGSGNSDGDPATVTVESMYRDALAAAGRLRAVAGFLRLAVVGTRLGGPVAVRVARELGAAALILWEPVVDGSVFLQEALRARLLRDLREGEATAESGRTLRRRLEEEGEVDILGYTLHGGLYRSLLESRLDVSPMPAARVLLIDRVSTSAGGRLTFDLSERWQSHGAVVNVQAIKGERSWWLGTEADQESVTRAGEDVYIVSTERWIVDVFGGSA